MLPDGANWEKGWEEKEGLAKILSPAKKKEVCVSRVNSVSTSWEMRNKENEAYSLHSPLLLGGASERGRELAK